MAPIATAVDDSSFAEDLVAAGGLQEVERAARRGGPGPHLMCSVTLLFVMARGGSFGVREAMAKSTPAISALAGALKHAFREAAAGAELPQEAAAELASAEVAADCITQLVAGGSGHATENATPARNPSASRREAQCSRVAASGVAPLLASLLERAPSAQLVSSACSALEDMYSREASRELFKAGVVPSLVCRRLASRRHWPTAARCPPCASCSSRNLPTRPCCR